MIPALTFTHSGGAARIQPWVAGIRLAGFLPMVVDDGNDPLPGWVRGWLEAEGVWYAATHWPRRGNLNGTDVAARICAFMAGAAAVHEASHALKVDDDTVVLDAELFTGDSAAGAVGLTWAGSGRGGAYGMAYALARDVASAVAQHLEQLPLDPAAPEDLTVWAAARALAPYVIEHEFDPEGGPFSALPARSCPTWGVEHFGVLTVGNPPPGGWGDRGLETGVRMAEVVRAAAALRASREAPAGDTPPAA